MTKVNINVRSLILLGLTCLCLGGILGGLWVDKISTTRIEYVDRPIFLGSIEVPKILKEYESPLSNLSKPILAILVDTLKIIDTIGAVIDTPSAVKDWRVRRDYGQVLFDIDTVGKFSYTASVQYNRMENFKYEFTARQKVITNTEYITKKFSPFVMIGFNNTLHPSFLGGVWLNNWGIAYEGEFINIDNKSKFIQGIKIGYRW